MFFISLLTCGICLWWLPWWALGGLGFIAGLGLPLTNKYCLQWALGAATMSAALAYVRDGQSHGLISRRVAGLFALPTPSLIFLLMGAVAFTGMLVTIQSARTLRTWFK